MAKKVKFPLEMRDGVQARTLEEFLEYFDIEKVVMHHANGKLESWLRNRFWDELADKVSRISMDDPMIAQRLCRAFDITEEQTAVDVELLKQKNEKLVKLKQYTDDEKYISFIDQMAFENWEIYDLLDSGYKEIYLCGEQFEIPLDKEGVSYIGVNEPTVIIYSKEYINLGEKGIEISQCSFDAGYQKVLDERFHFNPVKYHTSKYFRGAISVFERKKVAQLADKINELLKGKRIDHTKMAYDLFKNNLMKELPDDWEEVIRRDNLIKCLFENKTGNEFVDLSLIYYQSDGDFDNISPSDIIGMKSDDDLWKKPYIFNVYLDVFLLDSRIYREHFSEFIDLVYLYMKCQGAGEDDMLKKLEEKFVNLILVNESNFVAGSLWT